MDSNNLVEIFYKTADRFPENVAIEYENTGISYNLLKRRTESTAAYLISKGIKKGSKVLVFIPMSIKLYQTVLALFSIGAIVVFVDEWSNRKRLTKALEVVDVDAIIAPRKYIWLAYLLKPFYKIKTKVSIPDQLEVSSFETAEVTANETALITFTTGSTGLPKAANRTHAFLKEQFRILKKEIDSSPGEKCISTLPIVLLSILGTGATGIVVDFNQKKPEALDGLSMLNFIKKNDVNIVIASPFFIHKLAKEKPLSLPSLKKLITGGAPVFPDMAKEIKRAFPEQESIVAYGSTEAEPISKITVEALSKINDISKYGLPVGVIHEEIKLKIIKITEDSIKLENGSWKEWEVKDGEIGEVVVTGPHVLDSYYNSPNAFLLNKIDSNGIIWHRTGDSGRLIDDQLYLNGRCSQLIREGDRYLSLFVIEYQLSQINGVQIGTLLKENIIIEIEDNRDEEVVIEEIKKQKIPHRTIKVVEKIPRDPRHFSKIDYSKLGDILNF